MSPDRQEFLLHGCALFSDIHVNVNEGRWLWIQYGDDLIGEWIKQFPCRRPWGWWLTQVPFTGPRKQLKPGPKPLGPADWFGIPARWNAVPPSGMFETEEAYLLRHGLAGDDERRLFAVTGGADSPIGS
jgi:hypothetical protein